MWYYVYLLPLFSTSRIEYVMFLSQLLCGHAISMIMDTLISSTFMSDKSAQVLSLLPPYEGKSILELGAGIGRFTGELAKKSGQLIALDFIETVIKKVHCLLWDIYLLWSSLMCYLVVLWIIIMWPLFCRMKPSMDIIKMSNFCVLMWHPETWIFLKDP